MPITFDFQPSAIATGLAGWLGGYGQGQAGRAASVEADNRQRASDAAAMSRMITGQAMQTLGNVATQQLDYNNRVNLANLAHTQAMDMLPVRAQAAVNQAYMQNPAFGAPLTDMRMPDGSVVQGLVTQAQLANNGQGMPLQDFMAQKQGAYQDQLWTQELERKNLQVRYSDADEAAVSQLLQDQADLYRQYAVNGRLTDPTAIEADRRITEEIASYKQQVLPKREPPPLAQQYGGKAIGTDATEIPGYGIVARTPRGVQQFKPVDEPQKQAPIQFAEGRAFGANGAPIANPKTGQQYTEAEWVQENQLGMFNGIPFAVNEDAKGNRKVSFGSAPKPDAATAQPGTVDPRLDKSNRDAALRIATKKDTESGVSTIDWDLYDKTYNELRSRSVVPREPGLEERVQAAEEISQGLFRPAEPKQSGGSSDSAKLAAVKQRAREGYQPAQEYLRGIGEKW